MVTCPHSTLNEEEAGQRIKDYDADSNGQLTWTEYLENTYRYSPDQILELEQDANQEIRHFLEVQQNTARLLTSAQS